MMYVFNKGIIETTHYRINFAEEQSLPVTTAHPFIIGPQKKA